jgi:hypothetical protein
MMDFLRTFLRRGDWIFAGALVLLAGALVFAATPADRPSPAVERRIEIDREWLRNNQRRENIEIEKQRAAERH